MYKGKEKNILHKGIVIYNINTSFSAALSKRSSHIVTCGKINYRLDLFKTATYEKLIPALSPLPPTYIWHRDYLFIQSKHGIRRYHANLSEGNFDI